MSYLSYHFIHQHPPTPESRDIADLRPVEPRIVTVRQQVGQEQAHFLLGLLSLRPLLRMRGIEGLACSDCLSINIVRLS